MPPVPSSQPGRAPSAGQCGLLTERIARQLEHDICSGAFEVGAIEARDVELACRRTREHLTLALRTYGAGLDVQVDGMARHHIEALLAGPERRVQS
ncbi:MULTISPECIES: hypothetical protein [Streptomyces violaceusniger group]|uniref:Uncharacterized protein n=2 Tax=Streptomyces rhizosphaericus TaxID=114699 RepID=A0ABN1Q973_9ACTN|nr:MULTISPECIES: hypothetical protein [Streptomyces violaceusniger group]